MQCVVKGRFIGGALYEPKESQSGMKYSACVVLEPGEEDKIRAIRDEALKEKFGSKLPKSLKDWTLRKGDDEDYEHSFERWFINPKSPDKKRPGIMRRVQGELEPTEDVYPGCYVHVSVNAYAYESGDLGAGITLGLRGVLFWKDGEVLGGGFRASEFDGYDSEVDSDAFGEETSSLL